MNCPACGTAMTEVTAGPVKVQACKGGCGGLWFDEWVLGKVDEPDQSAVASSACGTTATGVSRTQMAETIAAIRPKPASA